MIVAFEGIDACGKSTQIKMLTDYANSMGIMSMLFNYPDYETETGKKILELLKAPERDPLVLQSLMTTNRYEQQWELEKAHSMGVLVILDRYWLSGLVYGLADGLPLIWLLRVHDRLIQPHQWLVLNISVEESFKRRPIRDDSYESNKVRLEDARQAYRGAQDMIGDVAVINAMQSPEKIHAEILRVLEI